MKYPDNNVFSNMKYLPITIGFDGKAFTFECVESAYQAFKCPERMYEFTRLDGESAKKLGSKVELRDDWEEIKDSVMEFLITIKFCDHRSARDFLCNYQKDLGDDRIGLILESVKNELKKDRHYNIPHNANYLCSNYLKELKEKRESISLTTDLSEMETYPLTDKKIAHCMKVAEYMLDNADKYRVDKEKAYMIGMLHDIGYIKSRHEHGVKGQELLITKLGVMDDITNNVIRYHGTHPDKVPDGYLRIKEFRNMLALMYDADMSIDYKGVNVGHKGRLDDIAFRYGRDGIEYETAKAEVDFCEKVQDLLINQRIEKDKEIEL